MSQRRGEAEGGVLSFTFLDVLSCTMGSLVLLVVVFGQRANRISLADALQSKHLRAAAGAGAAELDRNDQSPPRERQPPEAMLSAGEAARLLEEAQQAQAALDELRAAALERLQDVRARVAGIEDHERRLEHELAKLQITLQRLEEAEQRQSVDQQSAEAQLVRLREIIRQTEEQLEALAQQPHAQKSYAIVPYKGANGTFRHPIYVECTKDGVIIQPEGIRLAEQDFEGPIRSGNPLASAMRAAREELNGRAPATGQTDLPDPYPLLIVRPDGAEYYAAALMAVSAWDADYGYEFVEADWKLEYPPQDPRLAQVMEHAVSLARERQALLARVAPRRYGGHFSTGGGGGLGGGGAAPGHMEVGFADQGEGGGGSPAGRGMFGSTDRGGEQGSETFAQSVAASGPARYGEINSGASAPDANAGSDSAGPTGSAASGSTGGLASSQRAGGETGAAAGRAAGGQPTDARSPAAGGASQPPGSASGPGSAAPSGAMAAAATAPGPGGSGAAGGAAGAGAAGGAAMTLAPQHDTPSAAKSRGANWANAAASQRSSPITRPIQVRVEASQIALLPEAGGTALQPAVIDFHQSTDQVLDKLAIALQERIKDWGLAGKDMYWRPTLVLQVAPGAERHALRLSQLLDDSGVDVRLEQLAARPSETRYGR
ncbi:MAG: hypothetical protein IT424_06035 [Pirellulales bacterium]|nr:hypothetical protein [Pirellulales bacterium]